MTTIDRERLAEWRDQTARVVEKYGKEAWAEIHADRVVAIIDALEQAEAERDTYRAKMDELDRAYISEHGQRRRAEDEQDRLKNKLARRSETVSRLLEERNNAGARIQAVRDVLDEYGDPEIWAEDIRRALEE